MNIRSDEFCQDELVTRFQRRLKFWRKDPVRFVKNVFEFHPGEEITWQQELVLQEFGRDSAHVSIASGHGCFAKGTSVMRFDGSVVPVEDVKKGDELMGGDGRTSRKVGALYRGRQEMVKLVYSDGTGHTVNLDHILCLVSRRNMIDRATVSVREWLSWSEDKKKRFSVYRNGVDVFPEKDLPIPPYILGLWLGDGSSREPILTNVDKEVVKEWKDYAGENGWKVNTVEKVKYRIVSGGSKGLRFLLRSIGVLGRDKKHIPENYLVSSRAQRLELLAGIIDSDGCLYCRGYGYTITQKNPVIIDGIEYLARSLGFHVTKRRRQVKGKFYYEVRVFRGELHSIPCRIPRKRADPERKRQRFRLSFMIDRYELLPEDQYYGFELIGKDKTFLGGDFTVLHNSGKSTCLAWIVLWGLCCFNEIKIGVTAPTAPQLDDVLWPEIRLWLGRMHPYLRDQFDITASSVRVKPYNRPDAPPHWASARTTRRESPDALQGLHAKNMFFIIDESFGVLDPVYEPIEGALTTEGARVILAGNPTTTSGYAFQTFHRNRDSWIRIRLDSEFSPLVSKKSVENYEKRYGRDSDTFRIRVQGLFARQAYGQLISRKVVEEARRRVYREDQYSSAPSILGVDCSGYGGDRTVVVNRKGVFCEIILDRRIIEDTELAGFIWDQMSELSTDNVFIDQGYGQGVISVLRGFGVNPFVVNFGAVPFRPELYRDRRCEMWVNMLNWLKDEGGYLPDFQDLIEDLIGPTSSFSPKGIRILESKKDMKKRGLASPDYADALGLTFAAPVGSIYVPGSKRKRRRTLGASRNRRTVGYEKDSDLDY